MEETNNIEEENTMDNNHGFNNKKERIPIYSQEEVDSIIEELPKIYSGTSEPTSDLGKDGDIYCQYE